MMLLRLLLVVAVLGISRAIQPQLHGLDKHLEYHYSFEARVAADVGGIGGQRGQGAGEQVAGVAIRGRLIMQKVSDLKMGFEFEAIQVGSHHGPVGCDGMAGMPIKYRDIAHEVANQLYKPFFFRLNIKAQHLRDRIHLEMPSDDLLWMVNLRKSMVNNFQDYLILLFREMHQAQTLNLGHRAGQDEFPPVMASRREDTLFGRCLTWYTLEALTEEELQRSRGGAGLLQDMQTSDHQGKKLPRGGRIGSMEHDQLLKLTRIIDHDHCHDGPHLVRSAIGNFTNFGQPMSSGSERGRGNSDQFQRHSSYAYYVRGSPYGLYRIENVQAEGFLSYNPFGLRTQQLQTVTNQSLVLLTVTFTNNPMVPKGPMTAYSSTHFTVLSPYSKPVSGAPDWIIYSKAPATHRVPQPVYWEQVLLGVNSSAEDVAERKLKLVALIRSSVGKLRSPTTQIEEKEDRSRSGEQNNVGGTSAGQATSQLHSAQRLAAALPHDALHQVWDQLEGLHREVLVDVLAGSGSGPAVSLLLHLMTSQRAGAPAAIPLRHHAAIVLAMTLNTPDPAVALQLIEYIKTVNLLDEPIVGPIVYVSGARMLRRMCRNSTASLPYPIYGAMQCSSGFVVHAFGDYLLKRMQNVDPQNWVERATLLQAYASLGVITDLEQFNSLARSDPNLIVQTTAVYAMTSRYLDAHHRKEAMLSLWSMLVDQQLSPEVRQSALAAFVSWRPELHWWDQLAKLTRSSGNVDITRFVASTMETTAADHRIDQQQSQFAASALRLARPFTTPFSTSVNMRRSTHDDNIKTGLHGHLAWLKFPNSSHASQLYMSLTARAGTMPLNLLEFATGFNNYPGLAPSKTPSRSPDDAAPRPSLSEAEGHHDNRTPGPQMKLLLKLLNSEVFLPIDFQEFGISKYSQCPVCDLLWYNLGPCGGGGGGEALHLLQPAGVEAFLPNEMGLPVLAELVTPIVAYTNTSVEGSSCRASLGMSTFNITTDTKLVSKVTSVLKVLAPWIEFTVAAGVDLEKSLSIPVRVDGSIEQPFALSVDPTKPKKNAKKIPPAPSPSSSPSSSPAGGPSSARGPSSPHPGDPSPSSSARANCDQRRNLREERALYGTSLTLSMKSTRRNQTPVLFLQTVPFTCIKAVKPGNDNTDLKNLKVVRIKDAQPVKKVVPILQQSTGISAMLEYEGDGPFPYTLERLGEIFRSPSRVLALLVTPSTAFSRAALTVYPEQSNNTQCTFTLFSVSTEAAFGRNPDWLPTDRSRRGTLAQMRRLLLQSEQHQCKPGSPPCVSGGIVGMWAVFSPHQYFSLNTSHFVGPSHEHEAVHTSHLASLALKSGATFPHPYKVVAFSNFTRPAPLSLSELVAWLQPHATHSINMTANVTLWGGNLGQSLPLLASALVSGGVSEGRRKLVTEAVPTACAAERQDPATALDGRAVYDAITVRVTTHSKSVPEPTLARLSCLKAQLLAALHPSLIFDCSGQPRQHQQEGTATEDPAFNIYANRSLLNNKWSITCLGCEPHWHIRDQESLWCLDRTVFAMATRSEPVGNNTGPPGPRQTLRRVRLSPAVAPGSASGTSTLGSSGSPTPGNQQAMSDQLLNKGVNLPETDAAPADRNNQDYAERETADQPDEGDASASALRGKSCSTDNTHVVTFDGARYEKWGTKCYELAVANCANNPSFYVYTSIHTVNDVEVTKKDMPIFRYIDGDFKLNIEIAWRYLAINGLSPDHFGQPVDVLYPVTNEKVGHCEFVSSEDSYSCTMNDQVTMSPKRIGGVLTLPDGTNNVCGFCGNANNLAADDNIGAHLCQYTNMSLMAASWTLDASCPQDPTFGSQLEEVHGIQNNIENCNRLKFPFSWVEDPDLAPDAVDNNTLDQKQERQMMRLYQVDQRQQQLARRALQQYRRKTGLQSWEDVQQDQQQSQLLLLQEVIDGLKKSFLSPLPNSGPGSDAVSEAALQPDNPERAPSASVPYHGCMFSAYRVDFLPEPRDQVFLTVNRTNFCNHSMRCRPDNMERVRVTLFGWPLLAAPLPVVRAIDEGYLDELPPHLVPHTRRDGIHYQPALCSSRPT